MANKERYWTGGYYEGDDWKWLDGSKFNFTNWDHDQPNDKPLSDSAVAGSWIGGDNSKWHDFKLVETAQFICKR